MSVNQYWIERWEESQIGFHLPETHPGLLRWFSDSQVLEQSKVFVPLCGKSLDMIWLLQQGCQVIGVEVSQLAVDAFMQEQTLSPKKMLLPDFSLWRVDKLQIYCGDFFRLSANALSGVSDVYDRAALVALDKPLRQQYIEHLLTIIPENCNIFLITVDYDPSEMSGPPFAVPDTEVHEYFSSDFIINKLSEENVLAAHQHFADKGLSSLIERIYRLSPISDHDDHSC